MGSVLARMEYLYARGMSFRGAIAGIIRQLEILGSVVDCPAQG